MKKILTILSILLVIGIAAVAGPGGADDPILSASYLNEIYTKNIEASLASKAGQLKQESTDSLSRTYAKIEASVLARLNETELARASLAKRAYDKSVQSGISLGSRIVTLNKGDRITGNIGAGFVFLSGSGQLIGGSTSEIIDITAGTARKPGSAASPYIYYMISANDKSGVIVTSQTAQVELRASAATTAAYIHTPEYTQHADRLAALNMLSGTPTGGFELSRAVTRQEGLIMLLRMLGELEVALAYSGPNSFTDVGLWPDGAKYINYGYTQKYVYGIGQNRFDPTGIADARVYYTYILRALGYSDVNGDFTFEKSAEKAIETGLLTAAQQSEIASVGFYRDHMALLSYNALYTKMKSGEQTMGQRLVQSGKLTGAQLDAQRGLK